MAEAPDARGREPDQWTRTPWQLAWEAMEEVKQQLKPANGQTQIRIADVNDWVPTDIGEVFAYGWPNVISASLKASILALKEHDVKETMYGGLSPAEQDAAWSRVQEAQLHLQRPGLVAVAQAPADAHLYCCGPGGIHVFDPTAKCLGVIKVPEYTANFCWGDADFRSLYITASTSVYRIRTAVPGRPQMVW